MESLCDFYSKVVSSMGVTVKNDQLHIGNKPATVDEKVLILPTVANRKKPDYDKYVFFHPLSESMHRGESAVFRWVRRVGVVYLSQAFGHLGVALLTLQQHPKVTQTLTPEQTDLILGLSSTDDNSILRWTGFLKHVMVSNLHRPDRWALNVRVQRGGKYDGREYRRVGITTFPAYEYIKEGGRYFANEEAEEKDRFRQIDYPMFRQVYEAVFPEIKLGGEDYNVPYDGRVAPFFFTFLKAYVLVASRFNEVFELLREPLAQVGYSVDEHLIDLSWSGVLSEEGNKTITNWISLVPALAGNIGDVQGKETDPNEQDEEMIKRPVEATSTSSRRESAPEPERKGLAASGSNNGGWVDLLEQREREAREARARRQREDDLAYEQRDRERYERRHRDERRRDDDRRESRYEDRRDSRRNDDREEGNASNFAAFVRNQGWDSSGDDDNRRGRRDDDDYRGDRRVRRRSYAR